MVIFADQLDPYAHLRKMKSRWPMVGLHIF